MKIKYSCRNEDYLAFHLYSASKKKSFMKSREKSRMIIPCMFVAFTLLTLFTSNSYVVELIFISIAIIWYLYYPKYSANRYFNAYKNTVLENYSGRVNIPSSIEYNTEYFLTSSKIGESKIFTEQINAIIEITSHYFIRFSHGETIIIPKEREFEIGNPLEFINSIVNDNNEILTKELDWEWK